jgi:hypothetical protein
MAKLFDNLLGPLDKSACLYFYILSALFLFVFVFVVFGGIVFFIRRPKEIKGDFIVKGLLMLFNAFLAYFVNRLLYTMCSKSLA